MAEHIWTVLCHRACVDRETNLISLLEATEKVVVPPGQLEKARAASPKAKSHRLLARVQMQLATWWKRTQRDEPEQTLSRLSMIDVDGEEFSSHEVPVPLDEFAGFRAVANIEAIPIDRGSGTMWFRVSRRDDDEWTLVASIPLEIEIAEPSEQAEDS